MYRLTAPTVLMMTTAWLLAGLTGCTSSAPQLSKDSAAAAAFGDFRGSLLETRRAVDDSTQAIDRLAAGSKAGSADVNFNRFLDAYFRITGKNAELSERGLVMKDAGYEYFVVTNVPRLQRNPAKDVDLDASRTQTRIIFERLEQRLTDVRESLASYRSDLSGVYRYLNRTLTPDQISSATNRFAVARQDATDVETKLDSLLADVRDIGMSAGIAEKK